MMGSKVHIKKDDKVKILVGKDRGKIGKVLKVDRKKQQLLVENINIMKHHTKPSAANKQGGIVEKEAPIRWGNVLLMCNKCIKPVRVKMKILDDGKKMRVCRKCNEDID